MNEFFLGGFSVSIRQEDGRQAAQAAAQGNHFGDAAPRRAPVGALPPSASPPRPALGRGDGRHAGLRYRGRRRFAGQLPQRGEPERCSIHYDCETAIDN